MPQKMISFGLFLRVTPRLHHTAAQWETRWQSCFAACSFSLVSGTLPSTATSGYCIVQAHVLNRLVNARLLDTLHADSQADAGCCLFRSSQQRSAPCEIYWWFMTLSAALLSAFFAPFHLGAKVMYAPFHTSFAAASDVSEIAVGSVHVIYIRSSLKEPFCWFTSQVLLFLFC